MAATGAVLHSSAELTVGPGRPGRPHRIERMVHAAPVAWRPTPDAVYLVGTSASPVADDDVTVAVHVRSGAQLAVRSTAATVAWRGRGRGSRQRVRAAVGAGAWLDWEPEPMVATSGCVHHQEATVELAADACLWWREQLVLGRDGEAPGSLTSVLHVDVAGLPLLRHTLSVGPGAPGWDGPAVLGAARAIGLILVAGLAPPDQGAAGAGWAPMPPGPPGRGAAGAGWAPMPPGPPGRGAAGAGWALMPLDGPGVLAVAVASDAPALRRAMDAATAALAAISARPPPPR